MTPLPDDLARALDRALDAIPTSRLAPVVDRLIGDYRTGRAGTATAILRTADDAAAYAAYRMPATFAAVREALGHAAEVLASGPAAIAAPPGSSAVAAAPGPSAVAAVPVPSTAVAAPGPSTGTAAPGPSTDTATPGSSTDTATPDLAASGFAPRTLVDVGGGTGAAVWAAAGVWPSIGGATVLEGSDPVIELGRRLTRDADHPAVAATTFRRVRLDPAVTLPDADLITVSYVLGELDDEVRAAVVREAAARAGAVAVVEPGTPDGYRRVLAARDVLLAAGLTVVAPCPHDRTCPLSPQDWCHFAARVNRTSRHRRLKSGELGHEDEKYAYVVAVRAAGPAHARNRVIRHPVQRKGLVTLRLCVGEGGVEDRPVPRSRRDEFRAARDTAWGDAWPPLP